MRLDNVSYVVAVVCFLFAVIVFAITPTYISDLTIVYTLTVVLAILGAVLAGIGYSQRPEKTTPPTSTLSPESTAPITPSPVPTTSAPTPTPETTTPTNSAASAKETEKLQEETKPKKKAVRRRRKKA